MHNHITAINSSKYLHKQCRLDARNLPRAVTTAYARVVSHLKDHAVALALTNSSDPLVLARAGAHLAVLNLSSVPADIQALALAKTGRVAAAAELLTTSVAKNSKFAIGAILGIAAQDSALALSVIEQGIHVPQHIKVACASMGHDGSAATLKLDVPNQAMLAARLATRRGETSLAEELTNKVNRHFGLEPVFGLGREDALFDKVTCSATSIVDAGPKVSVVMTAKNEAQRAGAAIRSVLAQTWKDLELVFVDDGSEDDTFNVVHKIAATDGRLRPIRLTKNVGTHAAKNIGIAETTGKYLMCHDADDWSHPRKVELQMKALRSNPKLKAVSSSLYRVDAKTGEPYSCYVYPLVRWNPSSMLFSKELLGEIGWYHENRFGADTEYAARIETVYGGLSHRILRSPLSICAHRPGSLMTSEQYGIGASGWSEDRQLYLQAWRRWHARTWSERRRPYMPRGNGGAAIESFDGIEGIGR